SATPEPARHAGEFGPTSSRLHRQQDRHYFGGAMPSNSSSRVMNISRSIQPSKETEQIIDRLTVLATNGLPAMFYPEKQLFSYTLAKTDQGLVKQGISHRYTVITLMGLHRLELSGVASPIPIQPVIDALLADTAWVNNIGDL